MSSDLADALAFYRRETVAANRAFFQGKVDALYSNTELTDKQRLDKLLKYFVVDTSSVTSPRQLLIPPGETGYVEVGINEDGILPPETEEAQAQFLEQLRNLLRESAGDDIPEPAEFAELLTMTDAISGLDFRQSGSAGIHGTCDRYYLDRNAMSDRSSGQQGWYSDGWHVLAGWRCAHGGTGVSYLLYARKYDGSGSQDDQEFKWRVCTWDGNEWDEDLWFPSIAEFLRHRCQWFQRLPAGWQDKWKELSPEEREDYEDEDDDEDEDEEEE